MIVVVVHSCFLKFVVFVVVVEWEVLKEKRMMMMMFVVVVMVVVVHWSSTLSGMNSPVDCAKYSIVGEMHYCCCCGHMGVGV